MWFISKADLDKRFRRLNQALKQSFTKVRQDQDNTSRWIDYLHQRGQQQDLTIQRLLQEIERLNKDLGGMPKSKEDLRRILDEHYAHDALLQRMKAIEGRLEDLAKMREESHSQSHSQSQPVPQLSQPDFSTTKLEQAMQEVQQKLSTLEGKKTSGRERIIKRITKNSKDYVQSIILSYIKKYENVPAMRLKEMVVEDQQLCSKSSFYRLMEEIEKRDDIGVVREGREKHYFVKAIRRQ